MDSQDSESQPLTEESRPSKTFSSRSDTNTSASTTSLVLEHLNDPLTPLKAGGGHGEPYRDDDDAPYKNEFQQFDVDDDGTGYHRARPVDAKYRRWLWIIGTICVAGWLVAFVLMVKNGTYKHRSKHPHDPDATSVVGTGKKITLDQIEMGRWYAQSHDISWIAGVDGEDGLLLEKSFAPGSDGGYLVVEDIRAREGESSQKNNTVTLMKKMGFEFEGNWVVPNDVWPSPDFKSVLILSEKQHNWRHSFTGKYWLFDVESQTGEPLDPEDKEGRIQLAQWSPASDYVVFTRNNNMFLRVKGKSGVVRKITTDGGPEMFNGVPDWVYEEEVFGGNSATWLSADGKYIAYLATNETAVPEYPVQYFLSRPSGKEPPPELKNYPEVRKIKYPKAGAPNPTVRLRFYDVEAQNLFNVPIDGDFADSDRLITEVVWGGKTGKVLIRETNRESDMLKMVLVDVKERKGEIIRTQNITELDGGWYEISQSTTFVPADESNGRPHDGYIDTIIHEGFNHLGYFSPLDNDKPVVLTSGRWEVEDAPSAVDLKNNYVYFIGTRESSIQRHAYKVNLDGTELEPVTDTSKDGYYRVSFSTGAGYALVSYAGPNIPWQKVVSTPSNSESFEHLVEDNKDLAKQAAEHELPIKIYDTIEVDGVRLNTLERRPPHFDKRKQYPVLFYLYGGPGSQLVDKKFNVDFESYIASSLGYIVVTVDGRGTGLLGRAVRCIVRGNLGYWEAHDQIAAAKIWAKKSYVDKNRLAIWGWSYGGYMTLKTLEQDAGETFHYGMAVAPVTDWRFYDSIYTERWMHTPQNNPEGYVNSSIHNVTALAQNTRFLFMHGVSDDNVHFQNSLTLLDKLDLASVENYDIHVFPDSDHSIYFHNANRMVWDKLSWWLVNAFNGVWTKIEYPVPLKPGVRPGHPPGVEGGGRR